MKQGKRNNKKKEKNNLGNCLFMTPNSKEELQHLLPRYLHLC